MPSPWTPHAEIPPGQAKKHPAVPEAGTFEMVGVFLVFFALFYWISKTRRFRKTSKATS